MILIKLSASDGLALGTAVKAMAAAALDENKHKKARENAKTLIARELLNLRGINLDEQAAGEIVIVQIGGSDALRVERKVSQRLDQAALFGAHPDIAAKFTGPSVASYFSSLFPK